MSTIPKLPKEIFDSLHPAAQVYICHLEELVREQAAQILRLEERVRNLENRLNKNSSNSSKPPSTDGLGKKTKSLREQSGKKPGGQPGHKGSTLNQIADPDHIVLHTPHNCENCSADLVSAEVVGLEKRQVFDLPKPKIEVTEHQAEAKVCSCCGHRTKAAFPQHVAAPVQYGERIQALAAYFDNQHFIPADRLCQLFEDVFGVSISPGTCTNIDKKLFWQLATFEASLKARLIAGKILHLDETGMRCNKKLHWIHVASSDIATFYGIHQRRGQEAMNEFDILPRFRGTAIHDHWAPYFSFSQVKHGLCNAHHLRELTYIHEQEKEAWALKMKNLLLEAKKLVDTAEGNRLCSKTIDRIKTDYAKVVIEGFRQHTGLLEGASGKKKPGANLLVRFTNNINDTLAFIRDPHVPFTNNQAEQDVRMIKVRQKISGCFRTLEGGTIFCRIRSYISTARKQGWGVWDALTEALKGCPRLLSVSDS